MDDATRRILQELQEDPRLQGQCPCCSKSFPLSAWGFFDAGSPPPAAAAVIGEWRKELDEDARAIEAEPARFADKVGRGSAGSLIGSSIESIAPLLPQLAQHLGDVRDFRPLGKPIDGLLFRGVTAKGIVEQLLFAEFKSGSRLKLNEPENRVKQLVTDEAVEFRTYDENGLRPES